MTDASTIDERTATGHGASSRVVRPARSKITTAIIVAGCVAISAIPLASIASAHVKWFVTCDASDNPLPLAAVLTPTFWSFSALFVVLFGLACRIEQTALGASLSALLDHVTRPLHEREEVLLRAAAAVSFSLLWADGTLILTPELKGEGFWLSAIQALIAIYLAVRATLPAAAAGIVVLYGYGVARYGLFHMLDYPFFLGLAAYFALSVSRHESIRALRAGCLRWTVSLSLLWPAMEKFLYPAWIAPIAAVHPELTLGFDVATVITAAGIVEFGLAFALLWTPLPGRLAALALALLLLSATFDFGKVDGIGHLMIIAALLMVFAQPGRPPARRAALAPIASATTLLAAIFLYGGLHTLYYGWWRVAFVPLASGVALLTVMLLYLSGAAHALMRILIRLMARPAQRARPAARRTPRDIPVMQGPSMAAPDEWDGPAREPAAPMPDEPAPVEVLANRRRVASARHGAGAISWSHLIHSMQRRTSFAPL